MGQGGQVVGWRVLLVATVAVLLAGCGDGSSALVPTATATSTATATASRTPTSSPSPTATSSATPTSTPTATATPLDPEASGPFAVGSTTISFVRPSSTTGEPRQLTTAIWYPAPAGTSGKMVAGGVENAPLAGGGPFPLLVFSHGSCSLPQQSTFLTARLASHGFVVAAPPHPGNTIFDGPSPERCLLPGPLLADTFFNRADDVVFTIDQMLALSAGTSGALVGALDGERIGVLGHSFGAQTVLRVPAADPRVDAVLSLAPAAVSLVTPQIDQIAVPTMIQGA